MSKNSKEITDLMDAPSVEDTALIEKAYVFAADAHKDHKRLSGEPYLVHLVATAKGLASLGMRATTIAAGLLHDSIEDVGVKPETIEKEFGKEIRFLVEGVTKLGHFKYHGVERHRESLRKLLVATGQDARVLIIKLMDRLHNMQTLQFVRPEKRQRIAVETLEIYAAIAHRLGIGTVRRELEDLAFAYAYPKEYAETKKLLKERSKETMGHLEKMLKTLKRELADNGITVFRSDFRVKGVWSLYQKLKRKENNIENIHDVAAIRIIVPALSDCYKVLGLVHKLWQPLPNKIKDFIAFKKPNGYKSLHTTVFSGDGGIVEIQIRTEAMHQEAEYGIAAHVRYKDAEEKHPDGGRQSSFDWIRSLVPTLRRGKQLESPTKNEEVSHPQQNRYGAGSAPEWLSELEGKMNDPEIETTLKTEIFTRHVFVFTPTGDVVDLPAQSSPIDFAYAIHSDIGNHVFACKVNNKMVPLSTILHNGEIVEIVTRKNASPKQKWLDFTKTTLARRHIRATLEAQKFT